MAWDVFVSHASEDKKGFVDKLVGKLEVGGLKVWYDRDLTIGDSLRQKIDAGLAESKFGVVVLSPSFFAKKWPQAELDGLFALEDKAKKILPVWHNVDRDTVRRHAPMLADRLAVKTSDGLHTVVAAIRAAVGVPVIPTRRGTQLRTHLENYCLPGYFANADPSSVREHETSVKYWEVATDYAPVEEYREAMPVFEDWLKTTPLGRGSNRPATKRLSVATRRKHITAIYKLLELAGPSTGDIVGAGIIERPIKISMEKGEAQPRRALTMQEVGKLLFVCQSAAWERKRLPLPASDFWRCFILFAYNTGMRVKSLIGLRWDAIHRDTNNHSWVDIPGVGKRKGYKSYLSHTALDAIEPLRFLAKPEVFPWPYTYNRARSNFELLLKEAGIPQNGLDSNKFEALQRSCRKELEKINAFAARLQLGYRIEGVTLDQYTTGLILADAHSKLPQPPWTVFMPGKSRPIMAHANA